MSQGSALNIPTALASNSEPQVVEGTRNTLSQTLKAQLRVEEDATSDVITLLQMILIEARVTNALLHATLGSRDDLDQLRTDGSIAINTSTV